MESNNLFKYIFALVVVILIGYTVFIIAHNKSNTNDNELDQTSTLTNIKTDLRFAISELDTINPIISKNRNVQEITKIIYDPLVTLNENYKLEYCLADEIAKTDDVTYIVKLKKGILWEDDSNFTASDVLFTIDKIKNSNSIYTDNLRAVIGVDIIDSTTLKINLSEPIDFFEYNLTFPIMCEKYYEGEDFFTTLRVPIGTGMFRISEYSTNVIKLVPNKNYWDINKKPMATDISINLYSTIGEAYSAFKNGEIDVLSIKSNKVEEYIGTLGYKKIEYKARDYDFLALNTEGTVFSDINIRRAISLLIDKNNIIASCFNTGGYVVSNFSLDMGSWLYTRDLNVNSDAERAFQILIDDGWERTTNSWQKKINGRTHRLSFSICVNSSNEKRVAVAENIKEQLSRYSIPVDIRYLSNEGYNNVLNSKEFECVITGIRLGYSPDLNTFFGRNNLANYYNEELSEILSIVSNSSDENLIVDKYNRLFDIYLDEVPYIGLYRNTEVVIYNQSLVSSMLPNCFNIYHNIDKWYRQ